MTATVDSLPGKDWNAHAVAGDILERCPIESQILAIWLGPDGKIRYSKTFLENGTIAMFAMIIAEMAQQRWREWVA